MDYTTRVSVVGTLKGQDGRTVDQLRGVTVPVRFTDGAASFGPIPIGQLPPLF